MVTVFIPNDIQFSVPDRELFILTRPFSTKSGWGNNQACFARWGIQDDSIRCTEKPEEASILFMPYSVNQYVNTGHVHLIEAYSQLCVKFGIQGYAYISGDFGIRFPEFESITYFRMGGFRSQLSSCNQGFPVVLSDQLLRIYGNDQIVIRRKKQKPLIGFCGHASHSSKKKWMELLKVAKENVVRFIANPLRKDWEPFFASAWQRASILTDLERADQVATNFIYREHYRAGAITETERQKTTVEYYDNIRDSDYVLCLRGGGNFSVRLYETLMMGRIPVLVNTDCLMPFPDQINWKDHVVWVEWCDRNRIPERVYAFHTQITADEFIQRQLNNRKLWEEKLSVKGLLTMLTQQQGLKLHV